MTTPRAPAVLLSACLGTLAFPGLAAAERAAADLASFHSVPTAVAAGNGTLAAKIDRRAGRIEYRLSYAGLDSPALQAHIHFGNAWENGGIIAFLCTNLDNAPSADVPPCPATEGVASGVIEAADVIGPGGSGGILPGDFDALLDAIDAGAVYVNVHTEAAPAGQIRGQVD